MFPQIGSLRFGATQQTSLDTGGSDANLKADALLGLGICGPAYAVQATAGGDNPAPFTVALTDMVAQAGMVWGVNLNFDVSANFELDVFGDEEGASFAGGLDVDMLAVCLALIQLAAASTDKEEPSAFQQSSEVLSGVASTYGFFVNGSYDGSLSLNPELSVPINILPLIPELGEALEAASDAGITIAAGPVVGLGFPTLVELSAMAWDNLEGTEFLGSPPNQTALLAAPSSVTGDQVQFTLSHSTSIEQVIGVFACASFLDTLSVGFKWTMESPILPGSSQGSADNCLQTVKADPTGASSVQCQASGPVSA